MPMIPVEILSLSPWTVILCLILEVANDFYYALDQLYNNKEGGCFSPLLLNIPASSPLIIFGESYAGKYVPAIAKKIVEMKESGGFLTGLKGIAIGDGFTFPYEILSEVGTYSYHLGMLDYKERMKLEKILINASLHNIQDDFDALHWDFDNALDYVVQKAGDINVYDIKIDGEYEGTYPSNSLEFLFPYFRDPEILALYNLNPAIPYDGQADQVY